MDKVLRKAGFSMFTTAFLTERNQKGGVFYADKTGRQKRNQEIAAGYWPNRKEFNGP